MMNPLQAMMQARQANQMGGLDVQSQGAQQMTPLLQQAQMNVANPTMMQAQPARLMEMDKYKYVNAAQDRAQKDKQLLFNALDAKEARAQTAALQAQSNQQALQLEALRQNNAMDLQDRGVRLDMENAKNKLDMELKEKQKQAEILNQLNDKRFGPIRQKIGNVFQDFNRFTTGDIDTPGSALYIEKKLLEERLNEVALKNVTPDMIVKDQAQQGVQFDVKKEYGSPTYLSHARRILAGTPEYASLIASESQAIKGQIRELTFSKTSAYNKSLEAITKLGISVPEGNIQYAQQAQPNGITINSLNSAPSSAGLDLGLGGDKKKDPYNASEELQSELDSYDSNSLLYNPKTGQPGFITQGAKDMYGLVSPLLPEGETVAKLGGAVGIYKGAQNLMNQGDKGVKMQAGDYIDENLNRDGKPTEKQVKVKPKKSLTPTELKSVKAERQRLEKSLQRKGLTAGEKRKLQGDLNKINRKIDDAFPTYKKVTTPRQLTDQQFAQRKVKVFNDAAKKFGLGDSKFTPEQIKKMTPDQMSKKISQLKDGFRKRWGKKLGNSIYLKDDNGEVIRDKNGKPRAFREIPKPVKGGVAITFGMLAWDYMSAKTPAQKEKIIKEAGEEIEILNELEQMNLDQNKSFSIDGLDFSIQ